jgi:hypothetical protein
MPSSGLIRRLFHRKRLLSRKSSSEVEEKRTRQPPLPDSLLRLVFAASSPFDLIHWRAVSKDICHMIDTRFAAVEQLEVRKADINKIVASEPGETIASNGVISFFNFFVRRRLASTPVGADCSAIDGDEGDVGGRRTLDHARCVVGGAGATTLPSARAHRVLGWYSLTYLKRG